MNFIDDETRERIRRRRISDGDIEICLSDMGHFAYHNRQNTVYATTLPDGRNLKVEVNPSGAITNAFCHQ